MNSSIVIVVREQLRRGYQGFDFGWSVQTRGSVQTLRGEITSSEILVALTLEPSFTCYVRRMKLYAEPEAM